MKGAGDMVSSPFAFTRCRTVREPRDLMKRIGPARSVMGQEGAMGRTCAAAGISAALCAVIGAGAGAQAPGQPVSLPDGNGKALVETTCSACHGLNMITSSWGNSQAGWQELISSMVALPKD